MKIIATAVLFALGLNVSAQFVDEFNRNQARRNQKNENPWGKNRRDAIWSHSQSQHRGFGWFINPGITYMLGNSADDENRNYELTPSGLPGYYLEAGMEHLFKKDQKIVHYFDWGLGVKHFGGQEKYAIEGIDPVRGQFNFGSAFARAGIHNVWQLSRFNFIDQALGFNVDYRIYGGNQDPNYAPPLASQNQGRLVAQLNYYFGFGYKVRDGFFIVPGVQTPILTAVSFDDFNPSHHWFNSRYQPFIFTLKFAWLFPKKGCPDVDGMDDDEQRNNNYLNQ